MSSSAKLSKGWISSNNSRNWEVGKGGLVRPERAWLGIVGLSMRRLRRLRRVKRVSRGKDLLEL